MLTGKNDSDRSTDHRPYSRRTVLKGTSVTVIGGLAGCVGGSSSAGSGGATIQVSVNKDSPSEKKIWKNIKKKYEDNTSNKVNMVYTGVEEQLNQLARQIRGGNPPEVAVLSLSSAAQLLGQNAFVNLSQFRQDLESKLGKVGDNLYLTEPNGNVVGIPYMQNGHNLSVRGDLVKKAGFSVPKDAKKRTQVKWDEHWKWVQAMHDNGTDVWALPYGSTSKATQDQLEVLWAHGVEVWGGKTGDISLTLDKGANKKKAVKAIEHMTNIIKTGPKASGWSWGDVSAGFGSEAFAECEYSIGRMLQSIREKNPQDEDNVVPITPPFTGSRSDGTRVTGSVSGSVVFRDSKNPDAGKKWVDTFIHGQSKLDLILATPFHYYPGYPDDVDNDYYSQNDAIQSRPDILDYQREQTQYVSLRTVTAQGGFNPIAGAAYSEGTLGNLLARVVVKDMDPEDAITKTAAELRQLAE